VAGIVAPADLDAWGQQLAGAIASSLCSGSAFQSIAQQLDQSADILLDGSNRAGVTCDGISLGLGFDAVAVKVGNVVSLPTPSNPCADAGADAAGE
jgi:hypothetical protein